MLRQAPLLPSRSSGAAHAIPWAGGAQLGVRSVSANVGEGTSLDRSHFPLYGREAPVRVPPHPRSAAARSGPLSARNRSAPAVATSICGPTILVSTDLLFGDRSPPLPGPDRRSSAGEASARLCGGRAEDFPSPQGVVGSGPDGNVPTGSTTATFDRKRLWRIEAIALDAGIPGREM